MASEEGDVDPHGPHLVPELTVGDRISAVDVLSAWIDEKGLHLHCRGRIHGQEIEFDT